MKKWVFREERLWAAHLSETLVQCQKIVFIAGRRRRGAGDMGSGVSAYLLVIRRSPLWRLGQKHGPIQEVRSSLPGLPGSPSKEHKGAEIKRAGGRAVVGFFGRVS